MGVPGDFTSTHIISYQSAFPPPAPRSSAWPIRVESAKKLGGLPSTKTGSGRKPESGPGSPPRTELLAYSIACMATATIGIKISLTYFAQLLQLCIAQKPPQFGHLL